MPVEQREAVGVPVYAKFMTATVTVSLFAEVTGCGQESADELRRDLATGGFCGNIVEVCCCCDEDDIVLFAKHSLLLLFCCDPSQQRCLFTS